MKFNNKFVIGWWIGLLLIFGGSIYFRVGNYIANELIVLDYLILVLFFILVFLPLYTEMSMFGFSLKREIKTVEKEIKELKTMVISNSNSNHVYVTHSEEKLNEEQQKQLVKDLESTEKGKIDIVDEFVLKEEKLLKFFAIRYLIEVEIKRLSVSHLNDPNRKPVGRLIRILDDHGIFEPSISNALIEAYSISSHAIHVNEIRRNDEEFLFSTGPLLIKRLQSIG